MLKTWSRCNLYLWGDWIAITENKIKILSGWIKAFDSQRFLKKLRTEMGSKLWLNTRVNLQGIFEEILIYITSI